jgi:hypothetical protein
MASVLAKLLLKGEAAGEVKPRPSAVMVIAIMIMQRSISWGAQRWLIAALLN